MMLSKATTLIAGATALLSFFGAASATTTESMYFFEKLEEGDYVHLLDNGPFSLEAECSTIDGVAEARLWLTIDASTGDEWVYGMPDYAGLDWMGSCVGYYDKGSTEKCSVYNAGAGNSGNGGAFQSLTGYYIGWDSDTTIAFNKNYLLDPDAAWYHDYYSYDLENFPEEYTCVISGFINYASP